MRRSNLALRLIAHYGELAHADPTSAAYIASCVLGDPLPAARVSSNFVLSLKGQRWLLSFAELDNDDCCAVMSAIPQLNTPLEVPLPKTEWARGEDVAIRYLGLKILPINDLTLLAAHVAMLRSGNSHFRTSDVSSILKETNCEISNVSSTLKSMTEPSSGDRARVSKSDDGSTFTLTALGARHIDSILLHDSAYEQHPNDACHEN